ncbi:STAS domain-containing protein [Savagea sp. SN6]|uniref:STAS domain-containing protein n=1 Tax=Savagea serpentis TaxID=2785297 RepID=A0A8J7G2V6_9BACL|nr:STAS domain-containing protein [Savagea serpentis]MBF4501175.1 STAS domain-containing protein [Savagea serpentis]
MNNQIIKNLQKHKEEVMYAWIEEMKNEKGEKFFQYMPEHLVEKTSREFTALMLSNIEEGEDVSDEQSMEFATKIVRFGWSISFINTAIDRFSKVVFKHLEREGVVNGENYSRFFELHLNWIEPLRRSIIQSYSLEWERTFNLQKIALQELSASLIPVFEKISVMPLVGTIDTERAKLIMENLLEGVVEQRAEVVLLDITGVPVVDTMVAHHLIQAADAVRLVGSKCLLVGIRPEIAQTIVTLGIDLTDFLTTSTLQKGMEKALRLTNREIKEVE